MGAPIGSQASYPTACKTTCFIKTNVMHFSSCIQKRRELCLNSIKPCPWAAYQKESRALNLTTRTCLLSIARCCQGLVIDFIHLQNVPNSRSPHLTSPGHSSSSLAAFCACLLWHPSFLCTWVSYSWRHLTDFSTANPKKRHTSCWNSALQAESWHEIQPWQSNRDASFLSHIPQV